MARYVLLYCGIIGLLGTVEDEQHLISIASRCLAAYRIQTLPKVGLWLVGGYDDVDVHEIVVCLFISLSHILAKVQKKMQSTNLYGA